jgi:SAM-dependent methyltransferase
VTAGWENRAESWIEWTRRPNFDAYWAYRQTFLEDVLPAPGHATLEIGCGEGRVARDMARRGHSVTAIDASPTLIEAAAASDPESIYQLANAERLPFAGSSFDVVVAYNSLMDVENMPSVVLEACRVLSAEGTFAVCVTHPLCDAGTFTGHASDSPFVIEDSYRGERTFEAVVERDGVTMDFGGYKYDLESYARAFEDAGLAITRVREPGPNLQSGVVQPGLERGIRIPYFLMLRLSKVEVNRVHRGAVPAATNELAAE